MSDNDMIRRGDALADRAVRVAEALRNIGPMLDLRLSGATIIYELLAQNAALRAERDDAVIKRAAWELEAKTQKARAALKGADHE